MADRTFAAQLTEDIGPAGVRMVAAAFRGDLARLLTELSRASAAGDIVGFERAAHGLAGAAGAIGATALERACRAAMTAATQAALPGLLEQIRSTGAQARRHVTQLLATLDQSA